MSDEPADKVRVLCVDDHAFVVETAVPGMTPTRSDRIVKDQITDTGGMNFVFAVEGNAAPVDETFARPSACPAQGFRIEDHEFRAARDAALSRVEAHGQSLVRDVFF